MLKHTLQNLVQQKRITLKTEFKWITMELKHYVPISLAMLRSCCSLAKHAFLSDKTPFWTSNDSCDHDTVSFNRLCAWHLCLTIKSSLSSDGSVSFGETPANALSARVNRGNDITHCKHITCYTHYVQPSLWLTKCMARPILMVACPMPMYNICQNADDTQLFISLNPSDPSSDVTNLTSCLHALQSWFCLNGMALNPDKSDVILLGTRQRSRCYASLPNANFIPCILFRACCS